MPISTISPVAKQREESLPKSRFRGGKSNLLLRKHSCYTNKPSPPPRAVADGSTACRSRSSSPGEKSNSPSSTKTKRAANIGPALENKRRVNTTYACGLFPGRSLRTRYVPGALLVVRVYSHFGGFGVIVRSAGALASFHDTPSHFLVRAVYPGGWCMIQRTQRRHHHRI